MAGNIDFVIFQICLLLSFACLSGFTLKYKEERSGGRFDFFYFATITSWLLVIILFVLFLLRYTGQCITKYTLMSIGEFSTLLIYC